MTEANVSFAGNLTDDPELRHTEGGIAQAMFRVAVSGRREQEASFFTVIVWRDQAEHAAESLEGQPGRGPGPAPAAGMDRRGRHRGGRPPGPTLPLARDSRPPATAVRPLVHLATKGKRAREQGRRPVEFHRPSITCL
jgi:Single-strand binding protein family